MARKPDGASAGTQRVTFTNPAAERIGKVVREVEAGNRDLGPLEWGPRGVGAASKVFRVGTFTGDWAINANKTVTFRNVTSTPNTASVMNLVCGLSPAGSCDVSIAKDGTAWYLIQPVPATGGAKACTFTGAWGIDTDKAVTSIATGETINVTNILYTIPDAGVSMTCIAVQEGTAWQLANVRHRGTSVVTRVAIEGSNLVFHNAGIQVVGDTSLPTLFPLATCQTYSGTTVSATSVTSSGGAASSSSTSFFLG